MELQRTQILLEKDQHAALSRIASEESRSLSEVVREMIDRQLLYRQRQKMMVAARELQADYMTDPELTEFLALDSDDFLFGEEEHAKG